MGCDRTTSDYEFCFSGTVVSDRSYSRWSIKIKTHAVHMDVQVEATLGRLPVCASVSQLRTR